MLTGEPCRDRDINLIAVRDALPLADRMPQPFDFEDSQGADSVVHAFTQVNALHQLVVANEHWASDHLLGAQKAFILIQLNGVAIRDHNRLDIVRLGVAFFVNVLLGRVLYDVTQAGRPEVATRVTFAVLSIKSHDSTFRLHVVGLENDFTDVVPAEFADSVEPSPPLDPLRGRVIFIDKVVLHILAAIDSVDIFIQRLTVQSVGDLVLFVVADVNALPSEVFSTVDGAAVVARIAEVCSLGKENLVCDV